MSATQVKTLSICAIIALAFILSAASAMASDTFQPVFHPTMEVSKATGAIKIDGDLDDPGWIKAAWSDNFVERNPGDNIKPMVQTKVLVTYDQDNLYVAFIAYDDPSSIRATMCQRDQFNGDDAVIVLIDTYRDASWAYEFFVNPYGVQKDLMWTNIVGEDSGYDLIWNSAARITESGYQVEIAVPFSSIRFPNQDVQTWRIDFWRNHPRESYHQYSWAANDRNEQCYPCKWGTVNGIEDVHPGKGIEILPSLIATQSSYVTDGYDPELPFARGKGDGEISLGGKYSVNSDIMLEAAVNPDFSQIEADAAQIDVNTPVALFYPERRPFFQEGRDIFRTLFNSFYTRTVNDPQLAAKLTGRSGPYRFGFVTAVDENSYYLVPKEESSVRPFNVGKSYVNVFRAMRSIGDGSQIGLIVNDRRYESGGYNSILALDQNIRLSRNYSIDGQYIMTVTEEPDDSALYYNPSGIDNSDYTLGFDGETFTDYGFITRLRRNARNWNFLINFDQVGRAYRTETGYDPWVNYRNMVTWTGYNIYFDKGLVEHVTPQLYSETRWNFDGVRKWTHTNISWDQHLRFAQTYFSLGYTTGSELWSGKRFNDLWHIHLDGGSRISDEIGCSLSIDRGVGAALNVLDKGNELSVSAGLDIKPIDRLLIEPNFDYLKSSHYKTGDKLFENYVVRTRLRLQATKALSIRLVVQYAFREVLIPMWNGEETNNVMVADRHWDIDPLITFRLNPFTVFYVGTAYDYDRLPYDPYPFYEPEPDPSLSPVWKLSSRQVFMKLQYLFQT
ncbi:MAG: carbohydrate binding family 9 domain-containing protein [candidate division Zixibacteria bacterium]|nr:carbohydrate binding family 9 domain-containing protein [candidate division Zixibacteria bacterium]